MAGTALNKTDLAAWRSLITRPSGTKLLAAAALYLISSLLLPFAANETVSLLFVGVCALFFYMQTRTLASLIAPAIPAMLLFSVSGSMMLPAAFFAIVFGGACGAMLLLSAKAPGDLVPVLLPIGAYLGAILLGATPLVALLTLLPIPVTIVATLGVRRCTPFTPIMIALTATVCVSLLAAAGATLASLNLLDASLLPTFLSSLGDEVIALLEEAKALYAEAGVTIEISETAIRNLLAELINLSPAIFIIAGMVTAFFTWRTLSVLLVSFGALPRLPRALAVPTMSVTAAILFILAQLAAMIANADTATLFGAVAQNLALILEPGLALVGLGQLLRRNAPRSCFSMLALIMLVYLIWVNPATALAAAALYGAIHVLITSYQHAKNSKGEQ
ncbi:MAG: hypothetical protein E7636_03435 [Ruminococcaceae bacterium]|nr:hypothetical protein [Oscillospiraceae bacterium]